MSGGSGCIKESEPKVFVPKCSIGNKSSLIYSGFEPESSAQDQCTFSRIVKDYPGKVLKCQCQNASCGLKKLFREEYIKSQYLQRNLKLHETLKEELIHSIGGSSVYQNVYNYCLKLSRTEPQIFSNLASADGDTVLMELCLDKKIEANLLSAQILAFISIYSDHSPSLLFVRNKQNFNAFELAALSNKTSIASYLAAMFLYHNQDPNTTDSLGHTILHKLARKGDACVSTLNELLSLRNEQNNRILRLDIVNEGGKTPYDVVTACIDLFAHDHSLSYCETLNSFQKVIREDAEELMLTSSTPSSLS
ncbi:uncharacterized protein [Lepeophtheirus salmonis]|uniref:Putative LOC100679080 [Nasonia vitripennis] n=2 Tax=Lepeophtheirus salmonis TaxID=72036 RepID=A0A0K2TRP4_LEPSM|nr:uncharacterized protein LOC121131805 [Lepeophtheirus salmonis]XP_040583127.1 uncharacterized protein LOC121131805 [Lepeophtheirus salmonis]XP_040583128.1 uncharacterized protein LOC121131805 [Lepeophtheirus salmonis]XP_040583129.1 uncharacterized protein LOC121131805 [Lepeophtheirus salmonis]